jgi:hypothetical protein
MREECGAVWRAKQIWTCALSSGPSFGRASGFGMPLLLYPTTDTIPLPASACNAKSTWFIIAAVFELEEEFLPTLEEVY